MEYRLNKYISGSGICSRREADRYIENGHVTVDGRRASIGMRVLPGQKVYVNGELIVNEIEPVYIAFNKPVNVVCTTDPQEKDNIVDFISHEQRIFPIGRLDKDSQGLILLTNDGDIVNKILRVGNNHRKEYLVKVDRSITKEFLEGMAKGVPILDRVTRKCDLVQINPQMFKISLIQGLNRQIRRMCEYFGYTVTKLERIQIMHIKLNDLGQGNWRNLTTEELSELFDLLDKSEKTAKPKRTVADNKSEDKKRNDNKKSDRAKSKQTVESKRVAANKAANASKRPATKKKPSSGQRGAMAKPGTNASKQGRRPQSRRG